MYLMLQVTNITSNLIIVILLYSRHDNVQCCLISAMASLRYISIPHYGLTAECDVREVMIVILSERFAYFTRVTAELSSPRSNL